MRSAAVIWCVLLAFPIPAPGQDTRYAGDPLLLGAGARPLGMGSAFVALSDEATAVYWNPAGLPRLGRREVQIQHAEQFGGTVNHDVFTVAVPTPSGGFGVGLLRMGVGGIAITELEDPSVPAGPDNRPIVLRTANASDYSLHLAYGRIVSSRLSVGLSLKLIWRNLSVGSGSGWGFDLGAHYKAPVEGLTVGALLRNATRTRIGFDTGSSDRIPPSLLLGVAWSRHFPGIRGRLTSSVSVHLNEESSVLEDVQGVQAGAEYAFREQIAFRLGAEGDHFTAGAGVRIRERIGLDLAFLENGRLDNSYRISGSFFF
jgi:hypothetical protein